jgi:hypothetical protein
LKHGSARWAFDAAEHAFGALFAGLQFPKDRTAG